MSFASELKKIRKKNKDSLYSLGEKIGTSHAYVDRVEKELVPMSEKRFVKLLEAYPEDKNELILAYLDKKLPEEILGHLIFKEEGVSLKKIQMNKREFKVYTLDSLNDGKLLEEVHTKEMLIPMNFKFIDGSFCVEIQGNEIKEFNNDDIYLFQPIKTPIQSLNQKIVVFQKNKEIYMRKVIIENYKPYFVSLNGLFPPIENSDEIKIIGVITTMLFRDLTAQKF